MRRTTVGLLAAAAIALPAGAAPKPATANCLKFAGFVAKEPDRDYANRTERGDLLQFNGPADENEHGPVGPGYGSFVGAFVGAIEPGRAYRLRLTIDVIDADKPFAVSASGLENLGVIPAEKGVTLTVDAVLTATLKAAAIVVSTSGHNYERHAFVKGVSLCPLPQRADMPA